MGNNEDNTGQWKRDKSNLLKWGLEKAGAFALGTSLWIFTNVLDLKERIIRLETQRAADREQINDLKSALNQRINYRNIKE